MRFLPFCLKMLITLQLVVLLFMQSASLTLVFGTRNTDLSVLVVEKNIVPLLRMTATPFAPEKAVLSGASARKVH